MGRTEREILETAQTVLIEGGYESLSINAIADQMDITEAGVVPKRSSREHSGTSSPNSTSSPLQKSR